MAIQKRRSDRLMLAIPLGISGTDSKGVPFKDEARTIVLNRHGARIHVRRHLTAGQSLRITNLIGNHEAGFRVVGPVSPRTEKGGEWGVEYTDTKENIWGIQFPPPAQGTASDSKALLECRKCHAVALMPLTLVEVDVLETSGILSKNCTACAAETPWGYAEKQLAMDAPLGESTMVEELPAQAPAATQATPQRRHRRVALQLPVLIRDYYGGVEITKSENVSKGGFCFASEKNHHIGAGIMVVCPYSSEGQNIEVRARVVRRQGIEGANRKFYGVRYDPGAG